MDWLDLITNEVDRDTMRVNASIVRRSERGSANAPRENVVHKASHRKLNSASGAGVKDKLLINSGLTNQRR